VQQDPDHKSPQADHGLHRRRPVAVEDRGGASGKGSEDRLVDDDREAAAELSGEPARLPSRGVYLLPNLLTTGALFAGFYAIVAGMNGAFIAAALAVFVAMALDTADGRVARWTRTESRFGAEYDSLSDMVAFGVAPALVAFSWGLVTLGKVGWVATFIYMACAALRLARFNTKGDNATFTGLASPSAAAIIACCIWTWADFELGEPSIAAAASMALVTVAVGLLMVSPFRYYSPKGLGIKGRVPFIVLVLVVLVFAILLADPPRVLLGLFAAYALSGPVQALWRRQRKRSRQARESSDR